MKTQMANPDESQIAHASASVEPSAAPAQPNELVLTPFGMRPRSQVHILEEGENIERRGDETRIIHAAKGTSRIVSPAHRMSGLVANAIPMAAIVDWREFWEREPSPYPNPMIREFTASWKVPPNPSGTSPFYFDAGLYWGPSPDETGGAVAALCWADPTYPYPSPPRWTISS